MPQRHGLERRVRFTPHQVCFTKQGCLRVFYANSWANVNAPFFRNSPVKYTEILCPTSFFCEKLQKQAKNYTKKIRYTNKKLVSHPIVEPVFDKKVMVLNQKKALFSQKKRVFTKKMAFLAKNLYFLSHTFPRREIVENTKRMAQTSFFARFRSFSSRIYNYIYYLFIYFIYLFFYIDISVYSDMYILYYKKGYTPRQDC